MSDEMDAVTARLAEELASKILPSLVAALRAAIPSADFMGVFERSSRAAQELRSHVEKIIRSDIDENRASRSVLLESMSNIIDEVSSLKLLVERLYDVIDTELAAGLQGVVVNNQEAMKKLDVLSAQSAQFGEAMNGLKSFFESYAADKEKQDKTPIVSQHIYSGSNDILEKLLTASLPSLEGLLRANAKAQSKELEDFSRELSTQCEQGRKTLINDVKEIVKSEVLSQGEVVIAKINNDSNEKFVRLQKILRILMVMSGASITLTFIMMIMVLLK